MQAQGDHVLVRVPSPKSRSDGGIVMPDNSTQEFHYGRVESLGDGASQYLGGRFFGGEYVVFDRPGSVPVKIDPLKKDEFLVIDKTQVFASITEKELRDLNLPLVEDAPQPASA